MSIEERVKFLEEKVEMLSAIIDRKAEIEKIKQDLILEEAEKPEEKRDMGYSEIEDSKEKYQGRVEPEKTKATFIREENIGKYLIGGFAAVLIFLATILFVSLVWDSIPEILKFTTISALGVLISIIGLLRTLKLNNSINNLIFSIGAGIIYISIISGNLYFDYLGQNATIIMAAVWALVFSMSYRYIAKFFVIVVSWIGTLFTLLMSLAFVNTDLEYTVITFFVLITGLAFYWISAKYVKERQSKVAYTFIYLNTTILILFRIAGVGKVETIMPIILLFLALYFITNRIVYVEARAPQGIPNMSIGVVVATFFLALGSRQIYDLSDTIFPFLILTVNVLNLILVQRIAKRNRETLTLIYFALTLIPFGMYMNEVVSRPTGFGLMALSLFALYKKEGFKSYKVSALALIFLDVANIFAYSQMSVYVSVTVKLADLMIIAYILYFSFAEKDRNIFLVKSLSYTLIMLLSNSIVYEISPTEYYLSTNYIVLAVLNGVMVRFNYFKDWKEGIHLTAKNRDIPYDKTKTLLYIVTAYLILTTYAVLIKTEDALIVLVVMASLLAMLIHLRLVFTFSLKDEYAKRFSGWWIGVVVAVTIWQILTGIFDLSIDSVWISVSGIVMATSCIFGGFKYKINSLRLYGLILTIVMVLKFVLIDLGGENSLTRIVAFIIGGLLCFGISYIYSNYEKTNS